MEQKNQNDKLEQPYLPGIDMGAPGCCGQAQGQSMGDLLVADALLVDKICQGLPLKEQSRVRQVFGFAKQDERPQSFQELKERLAALQEEAQNRKATQEFLAQQQAPTAREVDPLRQKLIEAEINLLYAMAERQRAEAQLARARAFKA